MLGGTRKDEDGGGKVGASEVGGGDDFDTASGGRAKLGEGCWMGWS